MPSQDPKLEINQRFGGVMLNTLTWFQSAIPIPTMESATGQIGVHFEEVAEMLEELSSNYPETVDKIQQATHAMKELATHLKNNRHVLNANMNDSLLLDSLCDQLVTGIGVAYQLDLPIIDGLHEVNMSNWSKFEKGVPVFQPNGKIAKGKNYRPPNLDEVLLAYRSQKEA